VRFRVDDMLEGSGRFWCVFEGARLIRAFHGAEAKERAEALAEQKNREES
jgi:hypothetical protein